MTCKTRGMARRLRSIAMHHAAPAALALLVAGPAASGARAASITVTTQVNTNSTLVGAPWYQTSSASFGTVSLDSGWITGGPPNSGIPDGTVRAEGLARYGRIGVEAEGLGGAQYGGATVSATFQDTWTLVPTDPSRIGLPGYLQSYVTVNGSWNYGYVAVSAPGGRQFAGNPYTPSGSFSGTLFFETYVRKLGDPFPVTFTITGVVTPQLNNPSSVRYLNTAALTNVRLWQGQPLEYRMITESGFDYGFGVVPEPSTGLLVLTGLLGLAARRRWCT